MKPFTLYNLAQIHTACFAQNTQKDPPLIKAGSFVLEIFARFLIQSTQNADENEVPVLNDFYSFIKVNMQYGLDVNADPEIAAVSQQPGKLRCLHRSKGSGNCGDTRF